MYMKCVYITDILYYMYMKCLLVFHFVVWSFPNIFWEVIFMIDLHNDNYVNT